MKLSDIADMSVEEIKKGLVDRNALEVDSMY